jgi:hypothetical protein
MLTAVLNGAADLQRLLETHPGAGLVIVIALLGAFRIYRERQRLRFVRDILQDRFGDQITLKEGRWSSVIEITPTTQDRLSGPPTVIVPLPERSPAKLKTNQHKRPPSCP